MESTKAIYLMIYTVFTTMSINHQELNGKKRKKNSLVQISTFWSKHLMRSINIHVKQSSPCQLTSARLQRLVERTQFGSDWLDVDRGLQTSVRASAIAVALFAFAAMLEACETASVVRCEHAAFADKTKLGLKSDESRGAFKPRKVLSWLM